MKMRGYVLMAMAAVVLGAAALGLVAPANDGNVPELTKEQIARVTDSELLHPSREIVFETGKAPTDVCVSQGTGLAYVACLGKRLQAANVRLSPAQLCVVDIKTGEIAQRVSFSGLYGIALSPDGRFLMAGGERLQETVSNVVIEAYDTQDLARPVLSVEVPRCPGLPCVDNTGSIYIPHEYEDKLERIAKDLRIVQSLPLAGRYPAHTLRIWEKARSLLCVSGRGVVRALRIADDGQLLPPQGIVDLSAARLQPTLVVDEKRSLAYCLGGWGTPRRVIYVIDLQARQLVGAVTVSVRDWNWAWLALSPITDELWVTANSIDRIPIYGLNEIVRRAKEAGSKKAPARKG